MRTFETANLQQGYRNLCLLVLRGGKLREPRGLATKEIRQIAYTVAEPSVALPLHMGRGINPQLAAIEALQLIAGVSVPELLCKVAPNMRQFRDGEIFHGAYGPRLRFQLPCIIDRLQRDADTRQAHATIWQPEDSMLDTSDVRDLPCNTDITWYIEDDTLHQVVHARSQDVWWGTPYDVFSFCQLMITMANVLNVSIGTHTHVVDSLHIYERDWEKPDALACHVNAEHVFRCLGLTGKSWSEVQQTARTLLQNPEAWSPCTHDDHWYQRKLLEAHRHVTD